MEFSFHAETDQTVRTVIIDGQIYFSALDVTKALGYKNSRQPVVTHCKVRGVQKRDTPTSSGIQSLVYISESNVYRLVMRSKLPSAERFEEWIMEEVIPSIRKNGYYVNNGSSDNIRKRLFGLPKVKDVDSWVFDYSTRGYVDLKTCSMDDAINQLMYAHERIVKEHKLKSELIERLNSYISQLEQVNAQYYMKVDGYKARRGTD